LPSVRKREKGERLEEDFSLPLLLSFFTIYHFYFFFYSIFANCICFVSKVKRKKEKRKWYLKYIIRLTCNFDDSLVILKVTTTEVFSLWT